MKRPFTYICISFILGICFFYNIAYSDTLLLLALAISVIVVVLILYFRRGYSLFILLIFFILAGVITYYYQENSQLLRFQERFIQVEGIIKDEISTSDYNSKYILKASKIIYNDNTYTVDEKLILKVMGNKNLTIGDKIKAEGTFGVPKANSNPGLFNYKLYLMSSKIYTTMDTKDYSVTFISHNNLSRFEAVSFNFKNKITDTFDRILTKPNSALMKSIVLGDDSYLDDNTLIKFRDLGVAHVLAVSGLHIGIISAFLILLFKSLGINRKISILITIGIIWIYGDFIGYPSSVLRASIMFTCLMLSYLVHRRYDNINGLSLGALILLIYNPLWLFSIGFQLSFGATLSLVLFTKRIDSLLFKRYKRLGKIFAPLIAVQIGIIPILLYHFNTISMVSIISNLILIPVISFGLILGFIVVLLSLISFKIAMLIGIILNGLLFIFTNLANIIHDFFAVKFLLPSPTFFEILLYYLLVFILFKFITLDSFGFNFKKVLFIYLLIFITFLVGAEVFKEEVKIDFIDVGQGDCILVKVNNKNYLIDGGGTVLSSFDVGERIVLPYLLKNGVDRLDGAFVTHFDIDHCGGIISIAGDIKIDNILIGYESRKNELYSELIDISDDEDIPVRLINSGDRIILGKDIIIRVLSPERQNSEDVTSENDMSLVLLLDAYDKKVLFTGDIEKSAERELIEGRVYDVDILKVPHHGSKTSSTEEFIEHFTPEYAIISVGKNNFGHPNLEVINRYEKNNIEIFRTDEDGLITVEISKSKIKIYPYVKDKLKINDIILRYKLKLLLFVSYLLISCILAKNFNRLSVVNYKLSTVN